MSEIKFVLFIVYTTLIFFLPNLWQYTLVILLLNLIIASASRANYPKIWQSILHLLPFIILATVFNMLFSDIKYAVYIATKLILVCMISSIYTQKVSFSELSQVLQNLFQPLKFFRVNIEEISLVIYLAFAMITIMQRKISEINLALKAKNAKLNLVLLKQITLKLSMDFFREIDHIDAALRAKGIN